MANSVTHALPFPVKGARFSLFIPYLDADGDPTDPTTPDTERSIDAAAFADCTEEVTTISGSNGMGYITLTGDEMNGSMIAVCAKVASGPKATLATLYPRVLPSISTGTAQAGAAGTITLASGGPAYDLAGCIVKTTGGTGGAGGSGSLGNQARVITAYNTSTKVATVEPNWETTPDNTTTYTILLTDMAANALIANVTALLGTAWLTPGTAGTPDVNVKLISGDATSADNLEAYTDGTTPMPVNAIQLSGDATAADNAEAFFDGTGYAGTNNVIPTVTTTTTATNVTTVNGLAAGVITAASIAADAITAAKIADGAIDANTFAAGAITASAIAADAIGASELAADAVTEIQSGLATAAALATVDTVVDAILVDTAEIGAAGAGLTVLATQASVDVIDGNVDAILVDTGTTLQAELDGIQADTEDIQSRLPAALSSGNIKADILAINASTTAAARLALSAANMIPGTVDNTAFTATTTILESDDITEATADHYNGRLILFTSGALLGQVSEITDYALNGGRGRFTYVALTEAPANDSTFLLV